MSSGSNTWNWEGPTLNQLCRSDLSVLVALARACQTIVSIQLRNGYVAMHSEILHITLTSLKDHWGRMKERLDVPSNATPGNRIRSDVDLYDSQLSPIFTLLRYHEAHFQHYLSNNPHNHPPMPEDMPSDFCPTAALREIDSKLKEFAKFHFRRQG